MKNSIQDNITLFIGIDPDLAFSGMATWYPAVEDLNLFHLSFFKLYEALQYYRERFGDSMQVLVSAGWLQPPALYARYRHKDGGAITRIAQNVGENHATGKLICQGLKHLGIPYIEVKPTRKKIIPDYFTKLTGKVTKNQEEIDAAMLVYGRKTKLIL